jgi:multicomponent Na+:H+ antiporter subunit E
MKRRGLFVISFVLWLLLVWPISAVNGEIRLQDVLAGLLVAALVAFVMKEIPLDRANRWLEPARYGWAIAYLFVFLYYMIKANIDVAYRVLHPAMPIEPGIVKVKTRLKTVEGRTTLANSITLTPGTLTVDMTDDGTLYVHWINVKTRDVDEATREVVGHFEWFIERILE